MLHDFKTTVIGHLLNFNLHWHAHVMKNILLRYKILVLFLLFTLFPSFNAIAGFLSLLTQGLISSNASKINIFFSFICFQCLALAWLSINQQVFFKRPWDNYLSSLPLTTQQKTLSQIALLLLINIFIAVPVIIAAIVNIINISSPLQTVLIIEKTLIMIILMVLTQLCFINKIFKPIITILVIDVLIPLQYQLGSGLNQCIFIFLTINAAVFQFSFFLQHTLVLRKDKKIRHNKMDKATVNKLLFPLARIQLNNLLKNLFDLGLLCAPLSLSFLFSVFILSSHPERSSLLFIFSIIMLVNALAVSGLFSKFSIQRKQFSSYFKTLAISDAYLFISDCLVACPILVFWNCLTFVLMTPSFSTQHLSLFSLYLLSSLLLLLMTYFPQTKFKHYGFLMSLMLAPLFGWANYFVYLNLGN